jgi:hypothetical protein
MFSDVLAYQFQYTLGGLQKTTNCKPLVADLVVNKDSAEYRLEIKNNTKFTFVNNKSHNVADYDLLKNIEGEDIFARITLLVYRGGAFQFKMYFSPVDCTFDDDRCVCEVTPVFWDDYVCLKNFWQKEYNVLSCGASDSTEVYDIVLDNPAGLELFTCETVLPVYIECANGNPLYAQETFEIGQLTPLTIGMFGGEHETGLYYDILGALGGQSSQPYSVHPAYQYRQIFTNECFYANNFPYYNTDLAIIQRILSYWRIYKNEFIVLSEIGSNWYNVKIKTTWCAETVFAPYVNGQPDNATYDPLGYINFKDDNVQGVAGNWWGRQPFYNEYMAYGGNYDGNTIYSYFPTVYDCNHFEFQLKDPITWAPANETKIKVARKLTDVMQYILNKSNCDLQIYSQFLTSNTNPVTQETNPTYYTCTVHDIKNSDLSELSSLTNLKSFETLLNWVCETFNLRWYIEPGGAFNKLIIEHLSYFENNLSYQYQNIAPVDLTHRPEHQTGQLEIIATNKYTYNVGEMFNTESWMFSQYYNYDFTKLNIDYNLNINKENTKKEISLNFVTDIAGIIAEPSKFQDDDLVLVACVTNLGYLPVSVSEKGYRTNKTVTNGWMSLSNLYDRFYRNGRVKLTGTINKEAVDYELTEEYLTTKDNRVQEITIRDCDGDVFFDKKRIKTFLGVGRVVTADYNAQKDVTTLNILLEQ